MPLGAGHDLDRRAGRPVAHLVGPTLLRALGLGRHEGRVPEAAAGGGGNAAVS